MTNRLNFLILEDRPEDAELVLHELRRSGIELDYRRVDTEEEFRSCLGESPDVILADYTLPTFGALGALKILAETGHDIPFIIVSGSIGEDIAVEAMKKGATDYLLKDRLTRLPQVVRHALEQRQLRLEKVQAERALRESEERYRDLFENANDIVYTHDLNGIYTSINSTAEKTLGYSREEILGRSITDFIDPEFRGLLREKIAKKLESQSTTRYEVEVLSKDGRRVPLEVNSRLLFQDGQPVGVHGIARDITERKKSEEERRKLESQLVQSQKMESLGVLAGGIAHDFNNILSAVMGYSSLTMQDLSPETEAYANLQQVVIAARRAKELVEQILAFSRQGGHERSPIEAHRVIREALKLLSVSLPKTIEMEISIDPDCGCVLAHSSEIHQVVMNLCTNAAHAMEDTGGRLSVGLTESIPEMDGIQELNDSPESYLKIAVEDTGNGIDPEILDRIFEPFFTTKEVGRGTGMGLSVVHGIVSDLDGFIRVQSDPTRGTLFEVFLPKIQPPPARIGPHRVEVQQFDGRILFVDDEKMLVEMAEKILGRLGFVVTGQTCPMRALEAFESDPSGFDLVMSDYMMPRMTGTSLATRIKKIRGDIPIILMTGYGNLIPNGAKDSICVSDVLYKPILFKELEACLKRVLTRARS